MLFEIRVRLMEVAGRLGNPVPTWKTGIEALDFRRLHGLPDKTTLPAPVGYLGSLDRHIELPETLARTLLGPDQRTLDIHVHPDWLKPGEIVLADYHQGYSTIDFENCNTTLGIAPISLDRALDLLALSRLHDEIGRLTQENEQLRRNVCTLERELNDAAAEAEDFEFATDN